MKIALLFVAFISIAAAADRYPVDWAKIQTETIDYFTSLIPIDTSNPPDDETRAVHYRKPILATSRFGIGYLVDKHWNDIAVQYADIAASK